MLVEQSRLSEPHLFAGNKHGTQPTVTATPSSPLSPVLPAPGMYFQPRGCTRCSPSTCQAGGLYPVLGHSRQIGGLVFQCKRTLVGSSLFWGASLPAPFRFLSLPLF